MGSRTVSKGPRTRIAELCAAVWIVVACPAQQSFPSGTPPALTEAGFRTWCARYVEDGVARSPLTRSTTVYVSPDGNDVTGSGSIDQPFATVNKANALIASTEGPLRVRFRRGGVFRSTIGLKVGVPHVTVDSYLAPGDQTGAPRPVLTRFEPPVQPGQWAADGAPGTYVTNVPADVAWMRLAGDDTSVFRKATDVTGCRRSPGTWFCSSGKLYVHMKDDLDLRDTDLRVDYVLKNQETGAWVGDVDDVRLHDLRIDGFGAGTPGDHSYTGYGIQADPSGANRVVVTECETYYNGRHSITKLSTQAGGSLFVVGCRMGHLVNDGINTVGYSSLGGQELVSAYNEFVGSDLPVGDAPYPYAGSSAPLYAHTSDDAVYKHALFLSYADRIVPGQYQNADLPAAASAPEFTDPAECRTFVVGLQAECRNATALDATCPSSNGGNGLVYKNLGSQGTAYVDCRVACAVLWTQSNGDVSACTSSAGLWVNSDVSFDFSACRSSRWNRVVAVTPTNADMTAYRSSFYGCRITFVAPVGGYVMGFSGPMVHKSGARYNSLDAKWGGRLVGSVVDVRGGGPGVFYLAFGNEPGRLEANGYFCLSSEGGAFGCDTDTFRCPGTNVAAPPRTSTRALEIGPVSIGGRTLEVDAWGRSRSPVNRAGPLVAEPYTSVKLEKPGRF
ncbi:MAG: hypothetical protein JST30_06100 [Armatimonadetes bacterium]|nr:hypothetical protein [Armatimonadota bacterium]